MFNQRFPTEAQSLWSWRPAGGIAVSWLVFLHCGSRPEATHNQDSRRRKPRQGRTGMWVPGLNLPCFVGKLRVSAASFTASITC